MCSFTQPPSRLIVDERLAGAALQCIGNPKFKEVRVLRDELSMSEEELRRHL